MTQTTLIILNAVLEAPVVLGLIWLLASGIGSGPRVHAQQVGQLRQLTHDRIAA